MEYFLGSALKDEVMKIMPVQKQTRAGQRTRFKVRTQQQQDTKLQAAAASPCCGGGVLLPTPSAGPHLLCDGQLVVEVEM